MSQGRMDEEETCYMCLIVICERWEEGEGGGRGGGSYDHVCLLPVTGSGRWFRSCEERETRTREGKGREDGY